jgi:hypothetical protein
MRYQYNIDVNKYGQKWMMFFLCSFFFLVRVLWIASVSANKIFIKRIQITAQLTFSPVYFLTGICTSYILFP